MQLVRAGGALLRADAAADFQRALNAGAPNSVTSSYRDPAAQMKLYNGWIHRLPGYNFALHPDKSDHCKGIAVDLAGAAAKAWFRQWGAIYGWIFTDKSEDWHIAWRPNNPKYNPAAGVVVTPAPVIEKDWFDMATQAELEAVVERVVARQLKANTIPCFRTVSGGVYALTPNGVKLLSAAQWQHLNNLGVVTLYHNNVGPDAIPAITEALGGKA